jgi:hypothetical protein
MWTYQAPLRDVEFVINEWLNAPADWRLIPSFAELDADSIEQILNGAAQFAGEVLAPVNSPGDAEGCHYTDGAVITPRGYREAYR